MSADRQGHWERAYTSKQPDDASWFQIRPQVSLDLIERTGVSKLSPIIDVGGGASTLVDHLLDAGYTSVTVLDVAEASLLQAIGRLEHRSAMIEWVVDDVTKFVPTRRYSVWHDRAVLHFLTDPADQGAYADAVRATVELNGSVIIGGFSRGGPTRCSGLDIVQHDVDSLSKLLGHGFTLAAETSELHSTPWASEQLFAYFLFRRQG